MDRRLIATAGAIGGVAGLALGLGIGLILNLVDDHETPVRRVSVIAPVATSVAPGPSVVLVTSPTTEPPIATPITPP